MRILFLCDLHDYGLGSSIRQMYQQARLLREGGHEVIVVSCTQEGEERETEVDGTTVHLLPSSYPVRFRAWVSLDNKRVREPLRRVLERWRPDVVHAQLIHAHLGYASLTAARKAGAGVVFSAHDAMTFCYQKLTCFHGGEEHGGTLKDYAARSSKCIPCQRFRFRPGRNQAIRKVLSRDVHRFITVSDELATAIRANGIHVDRTIYNAIPIEEPLSPERVAAFRRQHDLEGKQVLAIGGRLHEQKGVSALFRMLARLAPDRPDLRLIVMGKRDIYDAEFAPLARKLGVHDRVVPTGWLAGDDLHAAYACADVFVTPSICFDTFGLVNLEAMAQSRPVVASSFGGLPEVVESGVTGYVENPFNLEAFTARLAELLDDPARADAMGMAGRQSLQSRFGIERLTGEFLEEYEVAMAKAQGSRR